MDTMNTGATVTDGDREFFAQLALHWRHEDDKETLQRLANYCRTCEARAVEKALQEAAMRDRPDGNWLDAWGSCRVCGGEIPSGHTNNCDIFKSEVEVRTLRAQLAAAKVEAMRLREHIVNLIPYADMLLNNTKPISAYADTLPYVIAEARAALARTEV